MLALALLPLTAAATPAPPGPRPSPEAARPHPATRLGQDYPLEVRVSFPAGLLHWLDTLTYGPTSGKTREAHLLQHQRLLGPPGETDLVLARDWIELRGAIHDEHGPPDPLTLAFFDAPDTAAAVNRMREVLDLADWRRLFRIVEHFEPRYERVWRGGRLPRLWLERVRDNSGLAELERFLVDVARFYGVRPAEPRPVLLPLPVPDGHGTHAQAVDRFLLIEVRPADGLDEQVAPIVHENAHLLFLRMPPAARETLERRAQRAGARGATAWKLLGEALPTAIAQGVADSRFRRGRWSAERPWYHVEEVDAYAKRLEPLVRRSLAERGRFDAAFLDAAIALLPE